MCTSSRHILDEWCSLYIAVRHITLTHLDWPHVLIPAHAVYSKTLWFCVQLPQQCIVGYALSWTGGLFICRDSAFLHEVHLLGQGCVASPGQFVLGLTCSSERLFHRTYTAFEIFFFYHDTSVNRDTLQISQKPNVVTVLLILIGEYVLARKSLMLQHRSMFSCL